MRFLLLSLALALLVSPLSAQKKGLKLGIEPAAQDSLKLLFEGKRKAACLVGEERPTEIVIEDVSFAEGCARSMDVIGVAFVSGPDSAGRCVFGIKEQRELAQTPYNVVLKFCPAVKHFAAIWRATPKRAPARQGA